MITITVPGYTGDDPNRAQSRTAFNQAVTDWILYTTELSAVFNSLSAEYNETTAVVQSLHDSTKAYKTLAETLHSNTVALFDATVAASGATVWSAGAAYNYPNVVIGSDGWAYRALQASTGVDPVGDSSGAWLMQRAVSPQEKTAWNAKLDSDDLLPLQQKNSEQDAAITALVNGKPSLITLWEGATPANTTATIGKRIATTIDISASNHTFAEFDFMIFVSGHISRIVPGTAYTGAGVSVIKTKSGDDYSGTYWSTYLYDFEYTGDTTGTWVSRGRYGGSLTKIVGVKLV